MLVLKIFHMTSYKYVGTEDGRSKVSGIDYNDQAINPR